MKRIIAIIALSIFTVMFSCKKDNPVPTSSNNSNNSTISGVNTTTGNNTVNGNNTVTGNNTNEIITFTNLTFGGVNNQTTIGCYFSIKNATIYKSNELNSTIGPDIDFVYVGEAGGISFFERTVPHTPLTNWGLINVPNGKNADLVNELSLTSSGVNFPLAEFDAMKDDTPVNDLTIMNDDNGFSLSHAPLIVVFKTSSNKKGVIKVKSGVSGRDGYVICDIKVQK